MGGVNFLPASTDFISGACGGWAKAETPTRLEPASVAASTKRARFITTSLGMDELKLLDNGGGIIYHLSGQQLPARSFACTTSRRSSPRARDSPTGRFPCATSRRPTARSPRRRRRRRGFPRTGAPRDRLRGDTPVRP